MHAPSLGEGQAVSQVQAQILQSLVFASMDTQGMNTLQNEWLTEMGSVCAMLSNGNGQDCLWLHKHLCVCLLTANKLMLLQRPVICY